MSENTSYLCKYCFEKMCLSIESTSLLSGKESPQICNPNVIKPCGCPELSHKSCLISILRSRYNYTCNICLEPYNLNIIEIASCFFGK